MSRSIDSHEACLKAIAKELKQEIKSHLRAWQQLDQKQAAGRRAAFATVIFILKQQLDAHGIPLADVGLVDYDVPEL